MIDPEGIAYDATRKTILVSSDGSSAIFELDRNGALINTISIAGMGAANAADLVMAPSSTGTGNSYYLVDRGLDNNSHPDENDGKLFEIKANMPPITNFPPVADAGVDQMLDLGETVTLTGAGVDSDVSDVLTYRWTKVSGPGVVTLATPNASTTTGTFSAAGDYVLQLRVTDPKGAFGVDTATIRVFNPGAARNIAVPIVSGLDDAQEGIGGPDALYTDVSSADNELGHNGNANMQRELTGLRFTNLPVPKGSEIVSAKVQFKVDEGSSGPANLTIVGEAADNALTYVQGRNANISSRPKTTASASWSPPTWVAPAQPNGGASGPGQLTPELKTILQEIVNRPGWQKFNAAAFMFSGDGRRTAEAKDGLTPPVLMLEFKTPTANTAPVVSAGADSTVVLPGAASLDGTVTDDGKPAPFTTQWTKVSGPGTVTFANAGLQDTTATFSGPGSYVLRLTANDTALTGQDDVNVTVQSAPAAGPPPPPSSPPSSPPPARVQPTITATVSDSLVRVGRRARITGQLSPALSGQTVKLQVQAGTTWTDLASKTVAGGSTATVQFKVKSTRSTTKRLRVVAEALGAGPEGVSSTVDVRYYRTKILRVLPGKNLVKVKNVGGVVLNLAGWVLKNKKNGRQVTLPDFTLKPGKVLRIHTMKGTSNRRHLFVGSRVRWGSGGKAVLKDDGGAAASVLRY